MPRNLNTRKKTSPEDEGSVENRGWYERTKAVLRRIRDQVTSATPERGGSAVDGAVAEYVKDGIDAFHGDVDGMTNVAGVGIAEVAEPGDQPKTAKSLSELLDSNDEGKVAAAEEALRQAEQAGADIEEVVRELDRDLAPKKDLYTELHILDGSAEIVNTLNKEVIKDGIQDSRPMYNIGGKRITFKASNEDLPESDRIKYSTIDTYDSNVSESIVCIDVKPDCLVDAAIKMTNSDDRKKELQAMFDDMQKAPPFTDKLKKLLTEMAACVIVQEDRNNGDAYAVIFSGLLGDEKSINIMREAAEYLNGNSNTSTRSAEVSSECAEELEKFVLVHSTEHPIQRNSDGDVIIYTAGSYYDGRLARSTIHFTVNGQVTSHAYGEWGGENRLIVTNAQSLIGVNGLPVGGGSQDTYFSKDLGEGLVCPNAVVVESSSEQEELFLADDNSMSYASKAEYTQEEESEIVRQAETYGVRSETTQYYRMCDVVREIALRKASESLGVEKDDMQMIGQHYGLGAADEKWSELMREINSDYYEGLHIDSGDAKVEYYPAFEYDINKDLRQWDRSAGIGAKQTAHLEPSELSSVSPETLRTLVWSGRVQVRDFVAEDAALGNEMYSGLTY